MSVPEQKRRQQVSDHVLQELGLRPHESTKQWEANGRRKSKDDTGGTNSVCRKSSNAVVQVTS